MRLKAVFRSIPFLVMAAAVVPASAGPSILIDVGSGQVLAHEEAFRRWYPASLTKLMTAYVTFRAVQAGELALDSPIRVTARSAKEPPSKMGYKPGSVMTLDNALKMIIIKSANDIATAIGENVAGSEEAFARRMNGEARRLGMTGTHFVNANGLHSEDQYTTARDLAILVRAIRTDFPQHADYFSIEALSAGKTVMKTYNMLVGRFPGADGMKTGFICPSGYNLIASATRNGRTLAAVVLGARSGDERAFQAAELLAQGFDGVDFAGISLAGLRPYGQMNEPTDMRPVICTKKAPAEKLGERDGDNGGPVKSPHLQERHHPLRVVAVGLGGATGPMPPNAPIVSLDMKKIPVPTPRPDYTPKALSAKGSATAADVPVPTPRVQ